jgi:hypothetical protein
MVGHEAIGVNLKTCLLAGLSQSFEEILPIHIVQENLVPTVATAHDVVKGTWVLDS